MMHDRVRGLGAAALAAALLLGPGTPAVAQEEPAPTPTTHFMLAGYGAVTYEGRTVDTYGHDFTAGISPILLFQIGTDLLVEAEFEFGLEGGETTTALEYAQIDYQGFEHVQLVAGKFLLPFGVFGERLHPSWINKLPTMPPLYGHAHGGVATGAFMPVPSDIGAMVRVNGPLGGSRHLDVSLYATQGPRLLAAAEGEDDDAGHAHALVPDDLAPRFDVDHGTASDPAAAGFTIPTVAFGTAVPDNNRNKMLGARVGYVHAPAFEVYLSAFHAMYDPDDYLDLLGAGLAAEWRRGPLEVRGEAVVLRQEFAHDGGFRTLESPGYYVQLSRRIRRFEPVLRWTHLLEEMVDDVVAVDAKEQFVAGVNYWVDASVPVKLAYEWNRYDGDRLLVQWAFGF